MIRERKQEALDTIARNVKDDLQALSGRLCAGCKTMKSADQFSIRDGMDSPPTLDYCDLCIERRTKTFPQPVPAMIFLKDAKGLRSGTSFRCTNKDEQGRPCRCNVFQKDGLRFTCNACGAVYTGEPVEP